MLMSVESKKKRQPPSDPNPRERDLRAAAAAKTPPPDGFRHRRPGPGAVGGLLPTIIAHTPLMAYFVRRSAMLDGTITFQSASIGWFSSASVSGIEICDAQGETVLEADSLTCDRSLLKLLFNSSNVGTLRIEKPRLNAKLTRDGSNVETLLARWLTGPSSSSSQGVDLSVEVADGEATIVDQETQQSWHVTGLQFALDMSRRLPWPTRSGSVPPRSTTADIPGGLVLKSHLKASDDAAGRSGRRWGGLAGTDGDLSLQTTTLPLAMFQRLAARGMPGLKLDGTLGTNIEAQWTGPANVKLNGSLNGSDLCVESPALGRDVLRLAEGPGRVQGRSPGQAVDARRGQGRLRGGQPGGLRARRPGRARTGNRWPTCCVSPIARCKARSTWPDSPGCSPARCASAPARRSLRGRSS